MGTHNPWPQIPNNGGPTLANPELVVVTYSDYGWTSQMTAWANWVSTSAWLDEVGSDYNVGTTNVAVQSTVIPFLTSPTSVSDTEIQGTLAGEIEVGVLPTPDANTLYMLFYPTTTTVTNLLGQASCSFFDGYHSSFNLPSGTLVAYAVLPDCGSGPNATDPGLTELQTIEVAASHELIEAASDPNYLTGTAWKITDPTSPWFGLDGEVGDQCEYLTSYYVDPTDTYWAQRIWSNTAAQGNGSPCVPLPTASADATPFFAESVEDELPILTAGSSTTFTVQAWSTSTAPTWTAYLFEVSGTATVQISPSSVTLQNGETATFTVTMPSTASGGTYAELIAMQYPSTGEGDTMYWPIELAVP